MTKPKIIRTATVALSLNYLLKGQLAYLNDYYEVVAVSGEDDDLSQVAAREKVTTVAVEMQRKISPFKDLKSLWQLYWLLKKEKPLIVHSITPKAGLLSMTAAYFAKVPIRMHTFTGLVFPARTGLLQKILIAMDKLLCQFATNIYPEGQGVKNDLIHFKITSKPLTILANGNVNGIDTAYFNPENFTTQQNQNLKNSLGIHPNDFVFIFVGRLVGDKGINELVAAFKNLQSKFPSREGLGVCRKDQNEDEYSKSIQLHPDSYRDRKTARLILVGPLETDLDPLHKNTLHEIEENPNIISVGFQKDVRPYLAISNCLAFPSYREGFPNVVMQAGAMGLPCIVTNINGCNEIIIEGQNGTIIPVKDTDALYNAMKKMVENDNDGKQLQQNARPMIVSRYEQHLVWEAILAEYKRLEQTVIKIVV